MKTDPLRILEVGMHFDPARGGVDRYFAGLVEHLALQGYSVTAAAFGEPEAGGTEPRLREVSLGSEAGGFWGRWQGLRRLRRQQRNSIDLLVTHFALYARPLVGMAPHVVHFHGPWAAESVGEGQHFLRVAGKRRLESRVYHSARRIIVLSGAFGDLLARDYGIPAARIVTIPGGIDPACFQPQERGAARRRLGWPVGGRILLCLRRLVPRMGLGALIEAFAEIAARHPDVTLVLAGRGPLADRLREQSDRLGLGERVRLVGFLPERDLSAAYSAADVTVVPSRELEGFGLITLESMACGTPVLVTPVGGLPETVRELDPRLVLEGAGAEALARGLSDWLAHPERLPSRERCRAHVEAHFSWTRIAARVAAVYEEAAR